MGIWQMLLGSWARWWNCQIKVNPTQVYDQLGRPVQGDKTSYSFRFQIIPLLSSFLLDKKPWLYSVSGDRPELPEQDDLVQPGGSVWAEPDLVCRSEHIAVQHRPHQRLHRLPAIKTGRHIHLVNKQRTDK